MSTASAPMRRLTVLAVSPHPDDEALGAPVTLQGLAARGHRVVNAACSLGRPADHDRRRSEAAEACRRAGLELVVREPPAAISSGDDLTAAQAQLAAWVRGLCGDLHPDLVVSPQPHDLHPGHEVVARATADGLSGVRYDGAWWMWSVWGDLPFPTLYLPFDEPELDRALHVLDAYRGETARNDYADLLVGRATMTPALASEKVFGFGARRVPEGRYAEALLELLPGRDGWHRGPARQLDLDDPLPEDRPAGVALDGWLRSPSPRSTYGAS